MLFLKSRDILFRKHKQNDKNSWTFFDLEMKYDLFIEMVENDYWYVFHMLSVQLRT